MTEAQVGFLYKAASSFQQDSNNANFTLLRSYYLMRCNEITNGYGLPDKYFSSKVRCKRCCVEWKKGTEIRVKPVKLSKKQRQRIRRKKISKANKNSTHSRKELLQSNELEQTCAFCKNTTITTIPKPEKIKVNKDSQKVINNDVKLKEQTASKIIETDKGRCKDSKKQDKKIKEVNVYKQTKEAFSLNNSKNTISSAVKEPAKVVKINKKKRDKFAGLCQKAVLASAKLKQETEKKNKLNLFLKPSS